MFIIEHDGPRAVLSPYGDGIDEFCTGAIGFGSVRKFQDSRGKGILPDKSGVPGEVRSQFSTQPIFQAIERELKIL